MRSTSALTVAGLLAVGACGGVESPTPERSESTPRSSAAATATAVPSPSPAFVLPEPGRPWDAETVLQAMAGSTRPDGVPSALQTPSVARAVAQTIWTVDGTPWDTVAIGGFCGTGSCTLEMAGAHADSSGEDLWVLEIEPGSASVRVVEASVRSLPAEFVKELDRLGRAIAGDLPDDAALATARWLPPPEEGGTFALSYRTGGEEGSCAIDLVVDVIDRRVVERTSSGC